MSDDNRFLSIDQNILGDVYTTQEPMDNLITLCDEFGSRFSGTPGEKQAVDFIVSKFKDYGLSNVHSEPFEYTGWTRGEVTFQIIDPIQKTIPCITLPHSKPADIEGTLCDMGDGAPPDFDQRTDEINGKIVMTNSVVSPKNYKRWVHRSEKYGRSLMAGATGFIFVNHYPGYGPATGGIGNKAESLIPGISIKYEDGAYIQRLIKRLGPVKVRITSTDECKPMTSWNIFGDLPGKTEGRTTILLGSHYDGHDISQGADDPASGVVAVMEAARVLAHYAPDPPRTIRFALWGSEEIGLLGSHDYVQQNLDNLADIRFYLNMDGAGSVTNARDIVLNEWPGLQPLFESWCDEMAADFRVGQSLNAFSDHFPFFMKGVPTAGIESAQKSLAGRGYGHTQYDTVDKVQAKGIREAAALAARISLRVSSADYWPVNHRSEAEVTELLDTPIYQEEVAYRKKLAAFYQNRGA